MSKKKDLKILDTLLTSRGEHKDKEKKQVFRIVIALSFLVVLIVLALVGSILNSQPEETPSHTDLTKGINDSVVNEESEETEIVNIFMDDGPLGFAWMWWIIMAVMWWFMFKPRRRWRLF